MKAVILAGGAGTRLGEETDFRPKPLVEIGGRPILWHIMKIFAHFGINEFVICLGYRGQMIKDYFDNYFLHMSDCTFDFARDERTIHDRRAEDWRVTLVDTGPSTMTGGRLKRVHQYIGNEPFFMTYGDGVGDIDIAKLLKFHRSHGKLCTVTAVRPPGRFGALEIDDSQTVGRFVEKPECERSWINGGFFVCEPQVLERISGDQTLWEDEPLTGLARDGELKAHLHQGFWQPMDTLRDKRQLESLWEAEQARWKVWQ